jgi:hypothetical protein
LEELELWLKDLVRGGLAVAHAKPKSYWYQMADRLVDAQASEIGREIRRMAEIPDSGPDWPERLLHVVGRLYLLIQGSKNFYHLSEEEQADLYAAVGWIPRSLQPEGQLCLRDDWLILGKQITREGKLLIQRTWLWGEASQQPAQILHIAHGKRPQVDASLAVGTVIDADICFYASAFPLKAQIIMHYDTRQIQQFDVGYSSIQSALEHYGWVVTANPWLHYYPMPISSVVAIKSDTESYIQDADGYIIRLNREFEHGWHMRALSADGALSLFGEWDGHELQPLSVWASGRLLELRILRGIS